ncbi:hypothetical protein [Flavobacteriaceae]|nr:hypothetical protein [Flavobacteriaceae]AOE08066.1 hypothetical protein [uncultured bacterium]MWW26821.1 hypothetical protein [Algibacter lectus]RXG20268.1 hypothetical protein DSM00_3069 [Leeuwenhoekiella aequorea]
MKRILFGIGIILIVGILILRCNIPMTKNSVVGIYANTNYRNEPCCVETPHKADTLNLKSDGTFSSEFYGDGTYDVNYGLLNSEIELHYEYEMGKAGYHTYFSNKIFEKPKIILNYDLNHYYEKVE